MEKTFIGDNASLPADQRLHIHTAGIKALRDYNEGVLLAYGPSKDIYNAEVMDKLLESMEVVVQNAHIILQERDELLSAVKSATVTMKALNDRLDAMEEDYDDFRL